MTQKRIHDFYVSLHDYQVGELLGSGTSANVYKARNLKTNELVALKVFKQNFHDEISKNQFVREIETMVIFDHPAILQLKGYSIPCPGTKETPTIATELMAHGSFLDVLIQESNDSPPAGWNVTKKLEAAFAVACGMMFIHNHNGIHRDLKPANILLDSAYEAKISDFGLSKIENEDSMQSLIAGTPLWMAPELFEQVQYTNKVDVFAYAITLYQVCTGKIPYDGKKNPMQIAMFITSGERPDIPISVPYFYAKLISDCWEQDPNDRPTFDDIVYRMMNTDSVLAGVNLDHYRSYQKRLTQFYPPHPSQKAIQSSQFIPNQAQLQQMIAVNEYSNNPNPNPSNNNNNNNPNGQQNPFTQGQLQNAPNQNPFNSPNQNNFMYEPSALGIKQRKHHHKKKKSHIKELICEGDVNAMYQYGMKLINKGRENKAAKYIITAANRNQLDALPVAAKMYEEGKVVKQNYTQAAAFWKLAADNGNVDAMIRCGRILQDGIGVNKNCQKALRYYKMAVDRNSPEAMVEMGRLLKQDTSNASSQQEAMNLFMRAIKLGNLDAYYEYGLMIEQQDRDRAISFYEAAGKKGHQKSHERLMYLKNQQNQNSYPIGDDDLTIFDQNDDQDNLSICHNDLSIFKGVKPQQQQKQFQQPPLQQLPMSQPQPQLQLQQPQIQQPQPQQQQQQPIQPYYHPQNLFQKNDPNQQVKAMPRPKFKDQASRLPRQGSNPNLLQSSQQESPQVPVHRSQSVDGPISSPLDAMAQPPRIQPTPNTNNGTNSPYSPEIIALKGSADNGNPDSCYKLGCLLMDNPMSRIVELQNAAVYLRTAARAGIIDAQYRCGIILDRGLGYPSNPQKAVYFYKQAADGGHPDALYMLAMCLMIGRGVPMKDPESANNYFKAAADMGHLQSQLNLAYNYDNGLGIKNEKNESNQKIALHYYKLAAAQNNATALCNLGFMAQEGRGMPQNTPNLQMAAECYRKAALLNDTIGLYNYAVILQNGIGVEKNIVEAAKFYKIAADKGSSDAQSNYALLISSPPPNCGLQKDLDTAKRYAKMAADQGNPTGQCIYAQLMLIVDKNKAEAIKYFGFAAEKGNTRAQKKLKELLAS